MSRLVQFLKAPKHQNRLCDVFACNLALIKSYAHSDCSSVSTQYRSCVLLSLLAFATWVPRDSASLSSVMHGSRLRTSLRFDSTTTISQAHALLAKHRLAETRRFVGVSTSKPCRSRASHLVNDFSTTGYKLQCREKATFDNNNNFVKNILGL